MQFVLHYLYVSGVVQFNANVRGGVGLIWTRQVCRCHACGFLWIYCLFDCFSVWNWNTVWRWDRGAGCGNDIALELRRVADC